MNKILVLDVDGVLNPKENLSAWPDFQSHRIEGLRVHLSKTMGAAIKSLNFDMFWLSTWTKGCDDANKFIGPLLDFAPMENVPADETLGNEDFKFFAIKEFVRFDGPEVIWIDDEISGIVMGRDLSDFDPHQRLVLIQPNSSSGLTKELLVSASLGISQCQ